LNTIYANNDESEMMGAHGFKPYMKHQSYAESANIPFLISYPGMGANAGKTAEAAITTPDILSSLLALCNIEIPGSIEGYDLSNIIRQPDLDKDRAALYMNVCPFEIAFPNYEYRALKTSKYTYVKTPKGPSMLFNDIADPLQMNNLIEDSLYIDVQNELDGKLRVELECIGETEVRPRTYYLKKFGFEGKKELRDDYAIKDYNKVEVVVSPEN
jgi:arylsulfatase A-like enzyme